MSFVETLKNQQKVSVLFVALMVDSVDLHDLDYVVFVWYSDRAVGFRTAAF